MTREGAPMLMVAGGTGTLGSAITRRALGNGWRVRVLTRSAARAQALAEGGADIAEGDLRDPASLERALSGITHVLTTANAFMGAGAENPTSVDELGTRNLVLASREARIRQFVFTSAIMPEPLLAIDYFAAKRRNEDRVRGSGLTWTILRPAAFMETWAHLIGDPLVKSGSTRIFGDGRNPVNFVAVDDVAAVAVMTLDRPDAMNAVVEIVGPENLTLTQVADTFERVTGKKGKRTHLPVRAMRMLAAGVGPFNPVFARQLRAGAVMASTPQIADPAGMLAKYPIQLTRLEDWVRARYH